MTRRIRRSGDLADRGNHRPAERGRAERIEHDDAIVGNDESGVRDVALVLGARHSRLALEEPAARREALGPEHDFVGGEGTLRERGRVGKHANQRDEPCEADACSCEHGDDDIHRIGPAILIPGRAEFRIRRFAHKRVPDPKCRALSASHRLPARARCRSRARRAQFRGLSCRGRPARPRVRLLRATHGPSPCARPRRPTLMP